MRRSNSAHKALNKKLIFERQLYTEIRKIFDEIASQSWKPYYFLDRYSVEIESALLVHYFNVFAEFGDDYRKANRVSLDSTTERLFKLNSQNVFKNHAANQSKIITRTNERQLGKIKRIAGDQLKELIKINSKLTFRELVVDLYSALLQRRIQNIVTYETQWSAEFSKANEVNFILSGNGIQLKARRVNVKRWDAVGDDKMRDWHADADSTIIEVDEPFIVNGEELMYPGDTSLGATASNIINCRCSVSYDISSSNLSSY